MKSPADWDKTQQTLIAVLFVLYMVVLIRSAWICDDAYITLRTVDNLYHGFGLTWNPGERVQTYTHPLWMGLLATTYFLFENPYYLLITLSIVISSAVALLLGTRLAASPQAAILGLLMLMTSRSFIDFSTAGLENPVSHLLVTLFILVFLRPEEDRYRMLSLSLIASLGLLNRMDLALVFLPALLYATYRRHRQEDLLYLALGFTPFLFWELFAVVYYGFPFPNTAYAKLNTGIPAASLIKQGGLFLLNSLSRDPFTLSALAAAALITLLERSLRRILLVLGLSLYLAYVVRVGGDYMSGRFLSVIACGAIALMASSHLLEAKAGFCGALLAVALFSLATPNPPLLYNAGDAREENGPLGIYNGIEDGRFFNFQQTGLLTISLDEPMPKLGWAYEGREARKRKVEVIERGAAGAFGFYAGPGVHVVDWYGIGDPLLARLPVDDPTSWRIGHFYRSLPAGYLETLESGEMQFQNPNLATYYQKLALVTQGPLFDPDRLAEICHLNIGTYQPLLQIYMEERGQ